ncbi:Hypothetical protein, putative [Bodo saltans]|uniref:Mitochondrial glycoprotein n=1 Tax=Bodo saltans TaxID=75058 RepID=A0A0S4J8B7_BODSA|nr:Hypothetical protein, putative [Bodo saltans]|eukprot:CUG87643.1 Hypothetical protein, putative [Bodo saltans]
MFGAARRISSSSSLRRRVPTTVGRGAFPTMTLNSAGGEKEELSCAFFFVSCSMATSCRRASSSTSSTAAASAAPMSSASATTKSWNNNDLLFSSLGSSSSSQQNLLPSETQLFDVCRAELRAEELRDAVEGVPAIAPMVPPGWSMEPRSTNSNYFVLTRHPPRQRGTKASSSSPTEDEDEGTVMSSHRKFRSRQQEEIERMERDLLARRASTSSSSQQKKQQQQQAALRLLPVAPSVQIFCPMRTIDPSLHDSSVDLCEWTGFDVLVRKQGGVGGGGAGVAEPARSTDVIMFSMASVNSELRLRSVQVVSPNQAKTAISVSRHISDSPGRESTVFATSPAAALEVVTAFDLTGEYYRDTQLYKGPLLSELSKPMQEELRNYVHNALGVTAEVREFIAQMLFVLEQEAYTAWLAQIGHFCSRK